MYFQIKFPESLISIFFNCIPLYLIMPPATSCRGFAIFGPYVSPSVSQTVSLSASPLVLLISFLFNYHSAKTNHINSSTVGIPISRMCIISPYAFLKEHWHIIYFLFRIKYDIYDKVMKLYAKYHDWNRCNQSLKKICIKTNLINENISQGNFEITFNLVTGNGI